MVDQEGGLATGSEAVLHAPTLDVVETLAPPEADARLRPGATGGNRGHDLTPELPGIDDLMIELSTVRDHRGALVFGEVGDHLPFLVKRMFMVLDVPDRKVRGEHAHRELHQLLICIDGSCRVALDDGIHHSEVVLDRPDVGVHIPPMIWGTQYDFTPGTQLLVLASDLYDEDDYIRRYDDFLHTVLDG